MALLYQFHDQRLAMKRTTTMMNMEKPFVVLEDDVLDSRITVPSIWRTAKTMNLNSKPVSLLSLRLPDILEASSMILSQTGFSQRTPAATGKL